MNRLISISALVLVISNAYFGVAAQSQEEGSKDIKDQRGKMKPWTKGAWETGEYRNVFLEAGYSQDEINAKLNKAYYDVFEGPESVYFEVGDSMAYVSEWELPDNHT